MAEGNPLRAMFQYEETVYRESKAVNKWRDRYGHPPAVPNSGSHSCSIVVVIMGHPLQDDGYTSPVAPHRAHLIGAARLTRS